MMQEMVSDSILPERGGPELPFGPVTLPSKCPICSDAASIAVTTGFEMKVESRCRSYRFLCGSCGEFQLDGDSLAALKMSGPLSASEIVIISRLAAECHEEGRTLTEDHWVGVLPGD